MSSGREKKHTKLSGMHSMEQESARTNFDRAVGSDQQVARLEIYFRTKITEESTSREEQKETERDASLSSFKQSQQACAGCDLDEESCSSSNKREDMSE